jgi:lysozyme
MKMSEKGKNLLKSPNMEGFREKPYYCSAGKPTIGYGSTYYEDNTPVRITDKSITRDIADKLFDITIKEYEECVNRVINKPMAQQQFDAFVMMCYNCGVTRFSKPAMVARCFNENHLEALKEWWLKSFVTANGEPSKGLVNRRKLELNHFLNG